MKPNTIRRSRGTASPYSDPPAIRILNTGAVVNGSGYAVPAVLFKYCLYGGGGARSYSKMRMAADRGRLGICNLGERATLATFPEAQAR